MKLARVSLLILTAAAWVASSPADAQIRASEPTLNRQTIDGTVFTIEYYRPKARGRAPLFGVGSVVWEEVWTPGANWATSIEFQNPIKLDGVALEAGKYAIWMEMSKGDFLPHELILEPFAGDGVGSLERACLEISRGQQSQSVEDHEVGHRAEFAVLLGRRPQRTRR